MDDGDHMHSDWENNPYADTRRERMALLKSLSLWLGKSFVICINFAVRFNAKFYAPSSCENYIIKTMYRRHILYFGRSCRICSINRGVHRTDRAYRGNSACSGSVRRTPPRNIEKIRSCPPITCARSPPWQIPAVGAARRGRTPWLS